ncbi:hypothetical protein HNP84_000858 [Thermocatellispora tengchongensis]|uniref:Uncharacterized protein n=1 Tax=Thermocatellispora tengchongensis TaxID=1073253 RepID=A0A840NV96_9ACTN|nr:hypothetical protein [Thermocatellispora tengchongensis]MBB5131152.1 hypothetical protein [Thermocatellispora tengchongensis]
MLLLQTGASPYAPLMLTVVAVAALMVIVRIVSKMGRALSAMAEALVFALVVIVTLAIWLAIVAT